MKGGKRPGAGRKKGTPNKRTKARQELAERALKEGITPLEYMLQILRQEPPQEADAATKLRFAELRFEAAKAAGPYLHPRPSPVDAPVQIGALTGELAEQGRTVLAAVSDGSITPTQAATLMQAIAAQSRIVEVNELERRIKALEETAAQSNRTGR